MCRTYGSLRFGWNTRTKLKRCRAACSVRAGAVIVFFFPLVFFPSRVAKESHRQLIFPHIVFYSRYFRADRSSMCMSCVIFMICMICMIQLMLPGRSCTTCTIYSSTCFLGWICTVQIDRSCATSHNGRLGTINRLSICRLYI